jgi:tungstate transport system substrate-binding protein
LVLATGTTVVDSGLLGALLPEFSRTRRIRVDVLAVGTGQALALARRGDADVVIAHNPAVEREFVQAGYGVMRKCFAYSTFAVVGPPEDPARVRGALSAVDAFVRIARRGALFVSRGDGSGTEAKERELWRRAGLAPRGERWYLPSGAGMGITLTLADEKGAYTLTDLPTYLTMKHRLRLAILYEGGRLLLNQYSGIATNPARVPRVNAAGARAFIEYLGSPGAQKRIADFGRERFGRPLFIPLGGRCFE